MGRWPKILIAVVMAAVVGFALYYNIRKWHKNEINETLAQEKRLWQEKNELLKLRVERLEEQLAEARGEPRHRERISEALGVTETAESQSEQAAQRQPEALDDRISAFFTYLDQRPYVKDYQLQGGTYPQYREAVEKLSQNPPAIAGETDLLYRLLKNIAHFYRVLGKQDVRLIKDVLANEEEILETVMRTYYRWFVSPNESEMVRPDDETLYNYAVYFLNTIGGRSYLVRRDSKVRTLTQYYCVLLVDRANDRKMNPYGIDIRPHIRSSLEDIRNLIGLAYRSEYIRSLESLQDKYEMAPASR